VSGVDRASAAFGKLLTALALAGCAALLGMMLIICADVFLRNVAVFPGLRSVPWANEVTEYALYFITMLVAPWLLRQGQHIRIDVLLRVIPLRLAWYSEWACDIVALACCLVMAFAGFKATAASMAIGSLVIKTLVIPEWWLLAPLLACFTLLAIEVVFRMARLHAGEVGPREDAVSTG
jgi:TRAP-type C4-dicarboxylate transport system permease small subunit